jgi:putative membrane protein insertion efficiency factor
MFGRILIGAVRGYQLMISAWTLPTCRFTPSCSSYAIEAIEEHGALRGVWFALRRLGRCHPWGGQGYDPVPTSHSERRAAAPTEERPAGGAPKVSRAGALHS